jgi:hypothetical protein
VEAEIDRHVYALYGLTPEEIQIVEASAQITFLNNQGTQGLQFAAVGGKAYELAKAKGLGHPLPLEWFVQDIRD